MNQPLRLFCFGLGYTAQVLAHRIVAQGGHVCGTVRTKEKAGDLRARGYECVLFEDRSAIVAALAGCDRILVCAPPTPEGDPALAAYGAEIARAAPRWVGYLSTTGVYGDCAGGWVDEASPLAPATVRAKRRVEAEHAWQELAEAIACPYAIFRLPGIYGPSRSAIDAVREGRARRIDKPGQVFSRIHVDDLAQTLLVALTLRAEGIYNVCDDEPAAQHEVIAYAARVIGAPVPPLEPFADVEASLSPMARSFYGESRRVRNAKMKHSLGIRLRYPTFREGLAALL